MAGTTMRAARGGSAFTLLELMLVVAVLGIIAAIAIPNYVRFQLRSKVAEVKVNLAAIRTAEETYFSEFGSYVACSASPSSWSSGGAAKQKTDWVAAGTPAGFSITGWKPEGAVFFQYQVLANVSNFTAEGRSDLDGDSDVNAWGYLKPDVDGNTVPGSFGCPASGVYNPVSGSNSLLESVGPCSAGMGQRIF